MGEPLIKKEYTKEFETVLKVIERFSEDTKRYMTLDIFEYYVKILLGKDK